MRSTHDCRSDFTAPLFSPTWYAGAAALPRTGSVNACEVRALLGSQAEKLLILDVRSRDDYAKEGHLPGSMPVPEEEIPRRLGEIPAGRPILILGHTDDGARRGL